MKYLAISLRQCVLLCSLLHVCSQGENELCTLTSTPCGRQIVSLVHVGQTTAHRGGDRVLAIVVLYSVRGTWTELWTHCPLN